MKFWLMDDPLCSAYGCFINQNGNISTEPNGDEYLPSIEKEILKRKIKDLEYRIQDIESYENGRVKVE